MEIIYEKENNFDDLIKDELVLVDFFATWCGPCRMLGPILEELSEDRNSLKVIKVDVDQNEELAKKYGIMTIPTMILFKNGELIDKHIGFMPKEEIENWVGK